MLSKVGVKLLDKSFDIKLTNGQFNANLMRENRLPKKRDWKEEKGGKALNEELHFPILMVGEYVFTKQTMITELGCGFFAAASRLNKLLKRFDAKTVQDIADTVKIEDLFAYKGVGPKTVDVLMYVFDYVGIDPIAWIDQRATIPSLYGKVQSKKKKKK